MFIFFCAGKEFCKKVEVYYCELCKFNLPPHEDVEQQLSLHCRNRVHLQRYVQHCEKTKSQEKTTEEVVNTQSTEEAKSDTDSSNKVYTLNAKIYFSMHIFLNYTFRVLKMKIKMMLQIMVMIQM